jgi:hypothetical protein
MTDAGEPGVRWISEGNPDMTESEQPRPVKYWPGYAMHFIHAGHVGRRPWGWREGVIRNSHDGTHVIDYVLEDGFIEVWSAYCPNLEPGTPVRMHEEYFALDVNGRWFNVRKDSEGLGPVPEPVEPALWSDEFSVGLVDNASGEGIGVAAPKEQL